MFPVSFDNANAFNPLPWTAVRVALERHEVPQYMAVLWAERCAGGSHRVLHGSFPDGVSVTCYADDTLVTASGREYGRTTLLAELGVAIVVNAIERLGFRVSPEKTQAIWFLGGTKRVVPSGNVRSRSVYVGGKAVQIRDTMKYLGLLLDGRWTFEDHFEQLAPRLEQTGVALCRHLPNIGGPDERVHRLYSGVIRSMALYEAPVWARN
ncbi:uncharacterized protein LOC143220130 [Lasioglossum baleicum]|uniref:uncharacterized protein LOC143220130 n=1 Tax=Lasioglossum baleicum TaxID=434251 RepID=UPI003FCC5B19